MLHSVSPNPHRLRRRQGSRQAPTFPFPINLTSLLELPRVSFWCFTNSPSPCALNNPIYPVGASSLKRLCAVRVRDLPTRRSCPTLISTPHPKEGQEVPFAGNNYHTYINHNNPIDPISILDRKYTNIGRQLSYCSI